MKILLTNDDGYSSCGLLYLDRALSEAGHEVHVIAPDGQRSAFSHHITMHAPVRITKLEAPRHFSCSGTPADCVLFGLAAVLDEFPDLVISGINAGFNASTDILYSGTVAGAREAAVRHVPSMALSLQDPDGPDDVLDFEPACAFMVRNLEKLYPLCGDGSFLNINFPKTIGRGFKVGGMDYLAYRDNIGIVSCHDGASVLEIRPGGFPEAEGCTGLSDFELSRNGWITITPIKVLPDLDEGKTGLIEQLELEF